MRVQYSPMSAAAQTVATVAAPSVRKPSGWDNLKTLLPYVARYKGMTALGLLTNVLMAVVGAAPQLVIGIITDCLKGSPQALSTLTGPSRAILHPLFRYYEPLSRHALGVYCALLVGLMLVKGFLSFWNRWILIGVSREIEFDLRNDMLARLVKLDPEFYVRNRTGDLMSRATNDLNNVRMVLGPGIMYTTTTVATMALAIFFMAKLSPSLTLWVLLPVPLVAVAVSILRSNHPQAFGADSGRARNFVHARAGKSHRRPRHSRIRAGEAGDPRNSTRRIASTSSRTSNSSERMSIFFPALTALIGLTVVILLGLGGAQVVDGRVSLGTFSAFYAFLITLIFPMIALGWVTNIFQRGAASMGRLNYILYAEPNIRDLAPAQSTANRQPTEMVPSRVAEHVQSAAKSNFAILTFTYPTASGGASAAPALRDINLPLPAGSTLAIVGPTGAANPRLRR